MNIDLQSLHRLIRTKCLPLVQRAVTQTCFFWSAQAKKITGGSHHHHHHHQQSTGQKLKTAEGQSQKFSGLVHRVSLAGYGVIKPPGTVATGRRSKNRVGETGRAIVKTTEDPVLFARSTSIKWATQS